MRWTFFAVVVVVMLAACNPAPTEPAVIVATISPTSALVGTSSAIALEPSTTPDNTGSTIDSTTEWFDRQRAQMVEKGVISWGIENEVVIAAMRDVPRHEFVPEEVVTMAYANHPLPIGYGQTISQPYIVALMTQAIVPESDFKVLEVGTGSGYQAAVLAEVAAEVYTMEIIGALAERGGATLERLGYDNVTVLHADGYFGLEKEAPFDAIVITAAPDHVPQPLVQQLKVGGRMIVPVGPVGGFQNLWLITRTSEDSVRTEDLGGVTFVPLTRDQR